MDTTPSSTPVVETVTKTALIDFEATATFKLSNIKRYFEDNPATAVPILTPFFGPQLKLLIFREVEEGGIAVYMSLPDSSIFPRPAFAHYTVTFSSSVEVDKITYCSLSLLEGYKWSEDTTIWGWSSALGLEDWKAHEPLRTADSVYIMVKAVGSLSHGPTSRTPIVLNLLHENIVASSHNLFRFVVFNRRDTVRKELADRRILLADREIVKDTCTRLHHVLSGKALWKGLLINDCPGDDPVPVVDEVILDGDSDFDDDDDAMTGNFMDSLSIKESKEPKPASGLHELHLPNDDIEDANSADDAGAEQDADAELKAVLERVESQSSHTDDQMQIDDRFEIVKATKAQSTQTDPPMVDGKALDVVVTGAAAVTWEAFIFYLYTGVIEFAPLSSRGRTARETYVKNFRAKNLKRPRPCSPKSMYHLAETMEQAPLKQLALKKIVEQLSEDNILEELFSPFTIKYEEVKEQELQFLGLHRNKVMNSQAFNDIVMKVAMGTYPNSGQLLGDVIRRMSAASPTTSEE